MSNNLGGITNQSIRNTVGDRSFTAAGLAIHGTTKQDVLTASAVVHCAGGVFQSNFTAKTQLDLSTLTVLNRKGETTSLVTAPAIASGGESVTKVYILACKGNTAYIIEPEEDTAAQDNHTEELHCPAGYAPFGAIKIVRAAGAAAFTLGTTALDATGVTSTFTDLSVCPASVSDLN